MFQRTVNKKDHPTGETREVRGGEETGEAREIRGAGEAREVLGAEETQEKPEKLEKLTKY